MRISWAGERDGPLQLVVSMDSIRLSVQWGA